MTSTMLQSAVRLPTPPPGASYSPGPSGSRKRSPPSRSPSPRRRRSPPAELGLDDSTALETRFAREHVARPQLANRARGRDAPEAKSKPLTEEEKQASAKAEYEKL